MECIWDARTTLGEGTIYSHRDRSIYWVDIREMRLMRLPLDGSPRQTWQFEQTIGWVVERSSGGLIAGLATGLHYVSLDPFTVTPLLDPEPDQPGNRMNDACVDAQGRIWAGTMDNAEVEPTGSLYRIDKDFACLEMDTGYAVSNGPVFSPAGDRLYHTDSMAREIYVFDVDGDGQLSGKRVFLRLAPEDGFPDGMSMDTDGCLWVAHWGGGRISQFDTRGARLRSIELPVHNVSNVCFGGDSLERMFASSARKGLSAEQLAERPLGGGLFELDPGARGLPAPGFSG
jgi:sugar lactone lactonase YvrE